MKRVVVNLTVITAYVPTLDVDSVLSEGWLLVAGNWNARPVPVDMAARHILG